MINSYRIRLYLFACVIFGGFSLLIYRLWDLQINQQDDFVAKLPSTGRAYQRIPAPRGRLLDRNGVPLADNKASLEVGLNLAEVENYWKEENALKPPEERQEVPKLVWDPRKDPDTDIMRILNQTIFPKLNALSLYIEPSEKMMEDIRIWYRENRGIIPYPYQKSLDRKNSADFRRFAAYAEYSNELPGISLRDRSSRIYPLKAFGAHWLGYVKSAGRERPPEGDRPVHGELRPGQDPPEWNFFENDDTGAAGIEKKLDADLRGTPGQREFLKNEHGRLADEIVEHRIDPVPGDDIYLTIDARIQIISEMALREAITQKGPNGIGRGAVTVIDPNTGEILAMASVPSFDPNVFIPFVKSEEWKGLNEDPTFPMVSRSLSAFPPGSTFKLVTAIAASIEGKANKSFNCGGSVSYGNRAFKCWTVNQHVSPHGTLGMADALKHSCNCYFYQCGNQAGIDRIEQVAKVFGFGTKLGIELDYQVNDFMPGEKWWAQQNKGPWSSAKTANVSIGQGEVLATPLEMALVAGTVANNGKSYYPTMVHHHVKHARNRSGDLTETRTEFKPRLKFDFLNMGENSAKAKDLATFRDGMWKVVNDTSGSTGRAAKSPYGIAGKTGTAQKWREIKEFDKTGKLISTRKVVDNHTWFVAFAPYDNPKVAVCILIANGKSGGGTAAPIAKRVIERSLGLGDGKYVQALHPIEPAKGNFDFVETVTFDGEALTPAGPEDDGSEAEETPEEPVVVVKPAVQEAAAAPRIEESTSPEANPAEPDVRKRDFRKQPRPQ
ncbi:MAG: penicillin-binding transpeptidase domain-containing protein [Verrucomicrobiota bacterium]